MHDPASGLRRKSIPRTSVNKLRGAFLLKNSSAVHRRVRKSSVRRGPKEKEAFTHWILPVGTRIGSATTTYAASSTWW
jgi:hypothetical protein